MTRLLFLTLCLSHQTDTEQSSMDMVSLSSSLRTRNLYM